MPRLRITSDVPLVLLYAFKVWKGSFFFFIYFLSGDCEIRDVLRIRSSSLAQRAQQIQCSIVAPFLGYKDKTVLFLLRPGKT